MDVVDPSRPNPASSRGGGCGGDDGDHRLDEPRLDAADPDVRDPLFLPGAGSTSDGTFERKGGLQDSKTSPERARSPLYSTIVFLSHVLLMLFLLNLFSTASSSGSGGVDSGRESIHKSIVQSWAAKVGGELFSVADYVTKRKDMQESYKQASVLERIGSTLVKDIVKDVKNMVEQKIKAIKRIMEAAEKAAMDHDSEPVLEDFQYYNAKLLVTPEKVTCNIKSKESEGGDGEAAASSEDAIEIDAEVSEGGGGAGGGAGRVVKDDIEATKKEEKSCEGNVPEGMRKMILKPSRHFHGTPVNTSYSSVHVPTNVYDKAPDVIKAIKWSEDLDPVFISNYQVDPSLSWQYFGSSHGFMRQYPAIQWNQEPVDLFDCRTRSWYIEAATSPKDVVVLVDFSGSMTGIRKEIARHVVSNILDTLGNNDYVNIFNFSEETSELVPCFKDLLVQANLGNVRELKMGMEDIDTKDIANFTSALIKAFELLQVYREERQGARCNQAIMLVTDGVPYNFQEIFEEYNWRKLPFMPVRVFTYLIGKEVADVREVKWIACENQGYYVHLSTLAEVREQVLNYIPVMARPMVLNKTEHPIVWTPVYADVTDPRMTDWLWEEKECTEQKSRFESYRKDKKKFQSREEQERQYDQKLKRVQNQSGDSQKYQLMTSVSIPVFDRRENANITERVLVNEAYWVQRMRETRVANLLGVAGTDIPVQDIQKLMAPHMLGVNAYAFIVTNNGYVIIHPDLRPVFQGILKPSYNSVDMAEVELVDDDSLPREFSPELLAFRDAVINQTSGIAALPIKYHYDDMKRVSCLRRRYYHAPIANTPFTLVVAIPELYGMYRVHAIEEIRRSHAEGTSVTKYFKGKKWKIHPDWVYCKYLYDNEHPFDSPEKELLHFLERTKQPGWKWPLKRSFPASDFITQCDRNLLLSLVFDAKVTEWFPKNVSQSSKEEKGKEFKQRFGITVSFVATRSGLTRWQDYPMASDSEEAASEPHFSVLNKRAIDEVWYKRAVEQHFVDPVSYVYSVPFKDDYRNDSLVTASNAIFHSEGRKEAPAAVVGFQFRHSALFARFKNITSTCIEPLSSCSRTCASSEELTCYALDNNGYVVVGTRSINDTGQFFGDVKPDIMRALVQEGVYTRVHIYDYQAVCFRQNDAASQASFSPGAPQGPFRHSIWFLEWVVDRFMSMLSQISYLFWTHLPNYVRAFSSSDIVSDRYEKQEEMMEGSNGPASGDDSRASMDDGGGGSGQSSHHGGDAGNNKSLLNALLINRTRPQPCDQEVDLYLLQHQLINIEKMSDKKSSNPYKMHAYHCNRPFVVQAIPWSNLILVVVDELCPDKVVMPTTPTPKGYDDWVDDVGDLTVMPSEIDYNSTSLACHKLRVVGELPRRNHGVCINSHPNESEITLCGRGTQVKPSHLLHITTLQVLFFLSMRTFGFAGGYRHC